MILPLVLSIISLGLCISFFFFFRWYIDRKTSARELLSDYRTETYRLIAEIDAAADRDSLLVEERIKTLKKVLDDTDRRISVYMRELQRSRAGEAMYTSLGRGIRAALDSRPPQLDVVPLETPPPKETPIPSKEPPVAEAAPKKTPPPEPVPVETAPQETLPPAKRKPKKGKIKTQIAELSAKGLTPAEIASKLNLSMGEVELAINLIQR